MSEGQHPPAATENQAEWAEVRKNQDFMGLLNQLEAAYPVEEWVVEGVQAWPVARIHLYYSFFDFQYFAREPVRGGVIKPLDVARVSGRVARSLARHVSATTKDRAHQQRVHSPHDAVFLNYDTYMTLVDGGWYSRVCDPLIERLSGRGLSSLMLTAGYKYSIPRHSPSAFIQPQLVLHRLAAMANCPGKRRGMGSLAALERHAHESRLFSPSFRLVGPVETIVRQIRGIARYFMRVLRAVQPNLVFVTCWYSTESMACVLACHALGIPCVDIQHGNQGFHVGYERWNRVPASGYNLLPHFFWCWSDVEASAIRAWSGSSRIHKPVAGGNLFLERWVDGSDETVRAYDRQLHELKAATRANVQVLYTLNGSTRGEIEQLANVIEAVNSSNINVHFWVRLHPIALDQKYIVSAALEARGIDNFDVDNGTLLPLYALLRHVDVHLTEFSSVVIEAQSFGVPSVISELAIINFPEQISSGWAVTARGAVEWVTGLRRQLDRRHELVAARRTPLSTAVALDELLCAATRMRLACARATGHTQEGKSINAV